MDKIEIGQVIVSYNRNTKVTYSKFEPTLKVYKKHEEPLNCNPDTASIEQSVKEAVSSWFSKVDDVWLADREQYEIKSELVYSKNYDNSDTFKEALYNITLDKV